MVLNVKKERARDHHTNEVAALEVEAVQLITGLLCI